MDDGSWDYTETLVVRLTQRHRRSRKDGSCTVITRGLRTHKTSSTVTCILRNIYDADGDTTHCLPPWPELSLRLGLEPLLYRDRLLANESLQSRVDPRELAVGGSGIHAQQEISHELWLSV